MDNRLEDSSGKSGKTQSSNRTYRPIQFLRDFWKEEISGRETRIIQIIFAIAIIAINGYIGYTYVNDLMINGWQLWTWMGSILLCGIILTTPRRFQIHWNKGTLALLLLFLAAILTRVLFLGKIPEGLHGDESGTINFTMLHVFPRFEQTLNPFITGFNAQPSLQSYIIRLSFLLGGYNLIAFRLPSAIIGALAVLATFFLVTVAQNRRTAWLAASVMAVYQYHLQWSRIGLNNVWATLWVPLVLALFLWGWREKWNGGAVLGGIALGLTAYFYAGGAIVIPLLIYIVIDIWFKNRSREDRHRLVIYAGKTIALAAVVAGPVLIFAFMKPDFFFSRTRDGFAWTAQNILSETGNQTAYFKFLVHQVTRAFGMYIANTDGSGFYAPGIPFLIGLAAPVSLAGFGWSIYKKNYLMLVWLLTVTILGGILIYAGSAHLIPSIPVVCWSIGAGLNLLWEKGWSKWAIIIFVIILVTELLFYFRVYPAIPRGDMNLPMPPVP